MVKINANENLRLGPSCYYIQCPFKCIGTQHEILPSDLLRFFQIWWKFMKYSQANAIKSNKKLFLYISNLPL